MLWRSRKLKPGDCANRFNDVLVSKNAFYLVCHDSRRTGKIAAFRSVDFGEGGDGARKFRFRYEQ